MYSLYCNTCPSPSEGTLDTESIANGWRLVLETKHKRNVFMLLRKFTSFETNPYKRFRVFHHRKGNTIIGRLVAHGDLGEGLYILKEV